MTRRIHPAAALMLPAALLLAPLAHADEGWFLDGALGTGNYSTHAAKVCDHALVHAGLTGDCSASKGQFPIRIGGGYNFSELWGLEGGYAELGNSSYTADVTLPADAVITGKIKSSALSGDLFVKFYPAAKYTITAKLGAYYAHNSISSSATGAGSSDDLGHSANNAGVLLGLKGSYELNANYSLGLEWDQYKGVGEAATSNQSNINLLLLNLTYNFR